MTRVMLKTARPAAAALAALLAATPLAARQAGADPPPAGDAKARAVPGTQRIFLAPTGRTLPAGTMEVGAYQVVVPYIGYAFHDRVMVAAGTPLLPGGFGRFWYAAPKVGLLAGPRLNVAAGGLLLLEFEPGSFAGGEPDDALSAGWGVATFGGDAAAVSLGALTSLGGPWGLPDSWVFMPGAELRLLGNDAGDDPTVLRLLYEGYVGLTEDRPLQGVHLVGIRFRGGHVAAEVVTPIVVDPRQTRFKHYPLVHLSVVF